MAKSNKFGTFGGVFTPSILTILGVIMYLRLPMIIGEAGLVAAIGIILVAHLISVTTGLSVSSIATDKKVEAGGTYYMISRSLGLPIGGTLGLALFVGLSFSVSLYLIGFSESFLSYWGFQNSIENIRLAGTSILVLVTVITFISTSLAIKTQYIIMTAIVLSLLSVFLGKHDLAPTLPLVHSTGTAVPLMVLFGIFFPAVTGFEAGVSMSGDLKDPKKSIPVGAISAIVVGLVVYIGLAFYFSYTVDKEALATDSNILLKIAWIPELVIAGIWGATLSSALGSILGAPRILQATATDRITHRFFAKGTKKTNEPRNALLLTFVIAEAGILIGDLDVIARIVSIFFITTYGFLNLSCAFERLTSADFRPEFKTPAWISIIGAAACLIVMIQLDFLALVLGSILLGGVYLLIKRKEIELESGDAWSGIWTSLIKFSLNKLSVNTLKNRNWRPNIIMFSGENTARPYMVKLGEDIAGTLGMLSGFELKTSTNGELVRTSSSDEVQVKEKSKYFKNLHSCNDIYAGMEEIIRLYGFNGIEPNTVLMGWTKNENNKSKFIELITRLEKNNFNSLFLNHDPLKDLSENKTIDIWWSGWGKNLAFAINLIRHLTTSPRWIGSKIRLFVITDDASMVEILYNSINSILEEYRVIMEVKIINNNIEQLSKNTIIRQESSTTGLTIIGIPDKKYHNIEKTYDEVSELNVSMGTLLYINASGNFKEYNIIGNDKKIIEKNVQQSELKLLPELKLTNYEVLNSQIRTYDEIGLEKVSQFHNKTFLPFFTEQINLISELKNLPINAFGRLNIWMENLTIKEKTQLLLQIQNETHTKAVTLIDKYINETLKLQKSVLSSGITWYNTELANQVRIIPKNLSIEYKLEEYLSVAEDSKSLKVFKRTKRWLHPFAKNTITGNIKLRKIASFYIEQTRQQHLKSVLKELDSWSLQFVIDIKDWLMDFDNQFEIIYSGVNTTEFGMLELTNRQTELIEKLTHINTIITKTDLNLKSGLQLEFRQTMQLLSFDLSKVNINHLIKKKKRKDAFYRDLKGLNLAYPQNWYDKVLPLSTKISLDLNILSLKNGTRTEILSIFNNSKMQINSELTEKIKTFIQKIGNLNIDKFDKTLIPQLDINSGFVDYESIISSLQLKIAEQINHLPLELSIYSQPIKRTSIIDLSETELITIPVQKIAQHFVENQLIGETSERFEKLSLRLNQLTFKVKDQLSYMHFELENLSSEEDSLAVKKTLNYTTSTLEEITLELETTISELNSFVNKCVEKAFEPILSHKIMDSSKTLSNILREYQGKKNINRLDEILNKIELLVKKITVKLLYSQSEGILLAQELNKQNTSNNSSEVYLELIDVLSPDTEVYETIPSYYKNLFSGKSSISDDFWIERKVEEKQFKKAIQHYNAGYHGGIMVTGERNSGKTALCQHISRQQFKGKPVYHIFPPVQGSTSISDFQKVLNTTLELEGNVYKVFEKLPLESVLVFHDIELWWESSEKGLTVINLLLDLIKKYNDKCLIIVNLNSGTFERINKIQNLTNSFISIITCKPFDSEDLKDLIMTRHRSRGLKFKLENRIEENISEVRLAKLFNTYFNYSKGNPGTALHTWIAHVTSYSDELLEIKNPDKPRMTVLENMPEDWKIILHQISLHKRMTIGKLKNVLLIDEKKISGFIDAFLRAGLIKEKSAGIYIINPYIDNFILNVISPK